MIRWAAVAVFCLLPGPLHSQDIIRPIAREAAPVVQPQLRPYERIDLAHGLHTRPWMRAEMDLWARRAEDFVLPMPPLPATRPIARGTPAASVSDDLVRPQSRPFERPDLEIGARTRPLYRAEVSLFALSPIAIARSMRPEARPASMETAAQARRTARLRGQVCGDPSIQGTIMGRVTGAGACGIEQAVKVRSVAGVTLSPRATIDCPTAAALKTWVERGVLPAVGGEGGGVSSLRVVSHYACRTRNNQSGARLSEHSFGRAIDIAGIRLRDGTEMTLLTDWNSNDDGTQLRQMWRAACGPFGTVLGPEANRFHRDHFHFDTARYRNGTYCR